MRWSAVGGVAAAAVGAVGGGGGEESPAACWTTLRGDHQTLFFHPTQEPILRSLQRWPWVRTSLVPWVCTSLVPWVRTSLVPWVRTSRSDASKTMLQGSHCWCCGRHSKWLMCSPCRCHRCWRGCRCFCSRCCWQRCCCGGIHVRLCCPRWCHAKTAPLLHAGGHCTSGWESHYAHAAVVLLSAWHSSCQHAHSSPGSKRLPARLRRQWQILQPILATQRTRWLWLHCPPLQPGQ